MRRGKANGCAVAAVLVVEALLMACAAPDLLYRVLPPVYEYESSLVAVAESTRDGEYTVNPDSSVTFDRAGLRVTVRYLRDAVLNSRYPAVSGQDRFSANPFTYGNWRDPHLGYTPTRFTVFEVELHNPVLPKVELDPARVLLRTDRGEEFEYYAVNREESETSFEEYYTFVRGPGGNEQYRYDQRMGIVRAELYRPEHEVFKGNDYKGYLVFPPLADEVASVDLHLREMAVRFDEADHPIETLDLVFRFERRVEKRKLRGDEARLARQRDWVLPVSARR